MWQSSACVLWDQEKENMGKINNLELVCSLVFFTVLPAEIETLTH